MIRVLRTGRRISAVRSANGGRGVASDASRPPKPGEVLILVVLVPKKEPRG
jgi:hypothetical protein